MTEATANKLTSYLPGTRIIRAGAYALFLVPNALLPLPMAASAIPTPPQQTILPRKFHSSIKQLIEVQFFAGKVDIDSTAIAAGLSSRTLQRKLKNMGTSYTKLVAETRIRLATKWIRKGKRSLLDIAQALGYNDPSNFSRAFRRVAGLSPRAFRNALAQEQQ